MNNVERSKLRHVVVAFEQGARTLCELFGEDAERYDRAADADRIIDAMKSGGINDVVAAIVVELTSLRSEIRGQISSDQPPAAPDAGSTMSGPAAPEATSSTSAPPAEDAGAAA